MSETIVRIENLSHRYGGTQWAIKDINFEIKEKGILGLLGSNGAGKSTTMNIICGVLSQTAGEVFINGVALGKQPDVAKKFLGFLPQKPPLYPDLTVDEYLSYCSSLRDISPKKIRSAIGTAKEICGIAHFSNRLIRNLSGGYQQRVGIAQAIVHDPAFVVLDEPTNGLDPNQIVEVRNLIREIGRDRAVLLSTHILTEVQATCSEIKMIDAGQMVFSGSISDFDSYIDPDTVVIGLSSAPSITHLLAIKDVTGVEELGNGLYRIQFKGSVDILGRLVDQSVSHSWGLFEIKLEKKSMDEVFAKLSNKEFKRF